MKPKIFGDRILYWIGPWPLTLTMTTTAAMTAGILLAAALVATHFRRASNTRLSAAVRIALRFIRGLVTDTVGHASPAVETFAGSLLVFIGASTLIGQLPAITAPTANLATTAALAAIVFLAVPVAGIRAHGAWGYFKHYVQPNPVLLPLHIVSELSRTLALALRLFGNMMSGHLIVALIVVLAGVLVPVPLMALDLLIGALQAYIFTILACVYIGAAMEIAEETKHE